MLSTFPSVTRPTCTLASFDRRSSAAFSRSSSLGGENQLLVLRICGDNLYLDLLIQPVLQVLHIAKRKLGSRDKAADSFYVSDYAGLDNAADFYGENGLVLQILYQSLPRGICVISHTFSCVSWKEASSSS